MILNVYAIYDLKAECFGTPFFFPQDGQAGRAFADLAQDKRTSVGLHPEDYRLFRIGTFNDHNAKLSPLEEPKPLHWANQVNSSTLTPEWPHAVDQVKPDVP